MNDRQRKVLVRSSFVLGGCSVIGFLAAAESYSGNPGFWFFAAFAAFVVGFYLRAGREDPPK